MSYEAVNFWLGCFYLFMMALATVFFTFIVGLVIYSSVTEAVQDRRKRLGFDK